MTDLVDALHISAAGMKTQGSRLRLIAENMANADSLGKTEGADPYRRKVMTFKNTLDRTLGIETVKVDRVMGDPSEFEMSFQPDHPAADARGYVKLPNVNTLIELSDMREAQRSYEANLKVIEASRTMLTRTIDILR
jgi:flagellar basal-body rod protein FlgC